MFQRVDENGDGHLSASELKALIIGIQFENIDFDKDDAVTKVLRDFDTTSDGNVDVPEFVAGITKWINEAKHTGGFSAESGDRTSKFLTNFHRVS